LLVVILEESPGYSKAGFHLTDGWGDPRASATERRPLVYGVRPAKVSLLRNKTFEVRPLLARVKGWCKRPPVLVAIQVAR